MKLVAAALFVIAAAGPALAQGTVVCPAGQSCNGRPAVPFPVIDPRVGLQNVLTAPQRQYQSGQQPVYPGIAIPPPVLPPAAAP